MQNIFSGLQCFRTDGRNRLYSGAFFNLLCVFKDTRAKAFSDFLFFIFYFCFCVLYSICIFSVRCGAVRVRVANWLTYIARCLCCLSYRARAFIQAQDAHRKTPKNPRRSREILTPPAEKISVSVSGVGSQNRYTAPTLLSSDIFLYLCIIKPYYISYG